MKGRVNKIKSAANNAKTPPSLLGIDRKIAYTHKKYHSGLMWIGVTRGFATIKFSGSVSRSGANNVIIKNNDRAIEYPNISLME